MPLTYAVTQYCPLHPTAQAYPAWSIHFITAPPCTLPPKFTSVGSAKNRSVICRSLSSITVAFYWAKPGHAPSVSSPRLSTWGSLDYKRRSLQGKDPALAAYLRGSLFSGARGRQSGLGKRGVSTVNGTPSATAG